MSALTNITRASLSKDLRLEWRSKDAINSMLFFALLVVVIFSFSFDPTAEESRRIVGGLIWGLQQTAAQGRGYGGQILAGTMMAIVAGMSRRRGV